MSKIVIEGNKELNGEVVIDGAKNSAVALIPSAVLANSKSIIYNVPEISDIDYLIKILELLNCKVKYEKNKLYVDSSKIKNKPIPEELSIMMRASYYFMGSLLAKFGYVEISYPGGCNIGNRPIDQHIKGFEALGAVVTQIKNKFIIKADKLKGNKIYLDIPSVGATINIMLAATFAEGTTIIENSAREPEIVNIASFLISMGAKIKGAGTTKITIEGVHSLDNGVVEVLPDRIETGTYLILGALISKKLKIKGAIKEHIEALLTKFNEAGIKYESKGDIITISRAKEIKPVTIKTWVYPGFPTDLQQPFTTLLTQAKGKSYVEEYIYESRFRNCEYLNLMGAKINLLKNNLIEINGNTLLKGNEVYATDLRAGASLLIAGLIAKGKTIINDADYILRGYGGVIKKLKKIGAKIEITE